MSIPVGRLGDRFGLTEVLLAGLVIYGIAGILPFWMDSLHGIIAARFLVGVGEAAVMVTSTALIGVLFTGAARARWLGAQVAAANFLGIVVLFGSGLLGLAGWHAPFLVYGFALVLLVPCVIWLPRPRAVPTAIRDGAGAGRPAGLRLLVAESCILVFVASMTLFSVIVQSGFLLEERGAQGSARIGAGMAIAATGIALGATANGLLPRWSTRLKIRLAFLLMGCGLIASAAIENFFATAMLGAVSGFGCGLAIPALLSRLLNRVPGSLVGGVIGIWIAATFIGQFANPPLFILLREIGGNQAAALGLYGGFCLATFVLLPFLMRTERDAGTSVWQD